MKAETKTKLVFSYHSEANQISTISQISVNDIKGDQINISI